MQTRRQFVAAAGTAAAAAVLGPDALGQGRAAPLARGGRFSEGVMSGEPTPRGITLWSRLHDVSGRVSAELEIARDADFRRVVARKRVTTSGDRGHSLKARVSRLRPHEQYFYRFSTGTTDGPVGRFRTALPEAYERLILDTLLGDATLFTRADEVDEQWSLVDAIIAAWRRDRPSFPNYAAGTWGPPSADELVHRDGRSWRRH